MSRAAVVLATSSSIANACLPADSRPEPGSVYVTAAPSEATRDGVTTDDDWRITFSRVVTSVGNIDLYNDPDTEEGVDTCQPYSEPHYDRLFDFVAMDDKEKVGVAYGRGVCSVVYAFRAPSDHAIIGTGATSADFERMRVEDSDRWSEYGPTSLLVVGSASNEVSTKRFEWLFRRELELGNCTVPSSPGEYISVEQLADGEELALTIRVGAEELFRVVNDDTAPLAFQTFALADKDGDGWITFEELGEFPSLRGPWFDEDGEEIEDRTQWPSTLLDAVYGYLLPRVTRIAGGGPCHAELRYGE